MENSFEKKLAAAIRAGWWSVLIMVLVTTLYYGVYLAIISSKPQWYLTLLGPDVTWSKFQDICLVALVAMKIILWVMIVVVVWLNLWQWQTLKGKS